MRAKSLSALFIATCLTLRTVSGTNRNSSQYCSINESTPSLWDQKTQATRDSCRLSSYGPRQYLSMGPTSSIWDAGCCGSTRGEAGWLKPRLVLILLQEPSCLPSPPSVSQQGQAQLSYCPPLLSQKIKIPSNVLDTIPTHNHSSFMCINKSK